MKLDAICSFMNDSKETDSPLFHTCTKFRTSLMKEAKKRALCLTGVKSGKLYE